MMLSNRCQLFICLSTQLLLLPIVLANPDFETLPLIYDKSKREIKIAGCEAYRAGRGGWFSKNERAIRAEERLENKLWSWEGKKYTSSQLAKLQCEFDREDGTAHVGLAVGLDSVAIAEFFERLGSLRHPCEFQNLKNAIGKNLSELRNELRKLQLRKRKSEDKTPYWEDERYFLKEIANAMYAKQLVEDNFSPAMERGDSATQAQLRKVDIYLSQMDLRGFYHYAVRQLPETRKKIHSYIVQEQYDAIGRQRGCSNGQEATVEEIKKYYGKFREAVGELLEPSNIHFLSTHNKIDVFLELSKKVSGAKEESRRLQTMRAWKNLWELVAHLDWGWKYFPDMPSRMKQQQSKIQGAIEILSALIEDDAGITRQPSSKRYFELDYILNLLEVIPTGTPEGVLKLIETVKPKYEADFPKHYRAHFGKDYVSSTEIQHRLRRAVNLARESGLGLFEDIQKLDKEKIYEIQKLLAFGDEKRPALYRYETPFNPRHQPKAPRLLLTEKGKDQLYFHNLYLKNQEKSDPVPIFFPKYHLRTQGESFNPSTIEDPLDLILFDEAMFEGENKAERARRANEANLVIKRLKNCESYTEVKGKKRWERLPNCEKVRHGESAHFYGVDLTAIIVHRKLRAGYLTRENFSLSTGERIGLVVVTGLSTSLLLPEVSAGVGSMVFSSLKDRALFSLLMGGSLSSGFSLLHQMIEATEGRATGIHPGTLAESFGFGVLMVPLLAVAPEGILALLSLDRGYQATSAFANGFVASGILNTAELGLIFTPLVIQSKSVKARLIRHIEGELVRRGKFTVLEKKYLSSQIHEKISQLHKSGKLNKDNLLKAVYELIDKNAMALSERVGLVESIMESLLFEAFCQAFEGVGEITSMKRRVLRKTSQNTEAHELVVEAVFREFKALSKKGLLNRKTIQQALKSRGMEAYESVYYESILDQLVLQHLRRNAQFINPREIPYVNEWLLRYKYGQYTLEAKSSGPYAEGELLSMQRTALYAVRGHQEKGMRFFGKSSESLPLHAKKLPRSSPTPNNANNPQRQTTPPTTRYQNPGEFRFGGAAKNTSKTLPQQTPHPQMQRYEAVELPYTQQNEHFPASPPRIDKTIFPVPKDTTAPRTVFPESRTEALKTSYPKVEQTLPNIVTMSNPEDGFLDEIHKDPGDSTMRRIYADWLQERDDPLGNFIILQMERLLNQRNLLGTSTTNKQIDEAEAAVNEQVKKEEEMLEAHAEHWTPENLPEGMKIEFERGFPTKLRFSLLDLFEYALEELLPDHPELEEQNNSETLALPILKDNPTITHLELELLEAGILNLALDLSQITDLTINASSMANGETLNQTISNLLSNSSCDQLKSVTLKLNAASIFLDLESFLRALPDNVEEFFLVNKELVGFDDFCRTVMRMQTDESFLSAFSQNLLNVAYQAIERLPTTLAKLHPNLKLLDISSVEISSEDLKTLLNRKGLNVLRVSLDEDSSELDKLSLDSNDLTELEVTTSHEKPALLKLVNVPNLVNLRTSNIRLSIDAGAAPKLETVVNESTLQLESDPVSKAILDEGSKDYPNLRLIGANFPNEVKQRIQEARSGKNKIIITSPGQAWRVRNRVESYRYDWEVAKFSRAKPYVPQNISKLPRGTGNAIVSLSVDSLQKGPFYFERFEAIWIARTLLSIAKDSRNFSADTYQALLDSFLEEYASRLSRDSDTFLTILSSLWHTRKRS